MSRRFDGRTKGEFKKDIKFTTQVESYFFERFLAVAKQTKGIWVSNPTDNGVDNSGEYLAKGNTAGADYRVDLRYKHLNEKQHPLEIKWVPTAGKFTLKENDLKAYVEEGASILFIYNTKNNLNLRKPKDLDLPRHIRRIESKVEDIRWGIMFHDWVRFFLEFHQKYDKFRPVPYMGNKRAVILPQKEYPRWIAEEKWL